jgi:hypothetical protein
MHVLKNPAAPDGSPWYPAAFTGNLVTPEWSLLPARCTAGRDGHDSSPA